VLKKINDGYVTRDDKYHFSDRARQILDKWRPLFEFNLKSRHWIARGNSSLMYLATDHRKWRLLGHRPYVLCHYC
jgi:hypothetical protein